MSADGTGAPSDGIKVAPAARPPSLARRLFKLGARVAPRALIVERGPANGRRRVALTFDDGPGPMTDAYLDILDRFGARATFFVVGIACEAHRETLLRIVARGHEVASHGFSHELFTKMDAGTLRDELRRTAALIPPPRDGRPLVRPPGGATSMLSLARCAAAGYTTVLWSRDSDDCRTTAVEEVAARVAPAAIAPGEIVLLHEEQSWTLAALPRIMGALIAADWEAVTVGELLRPGS